MPLGRLLTRPKIGAIQGIGFGFILVMLTGVEFFGLRTMAELKRDLDLATTDWLQRAIAISELNLNTSELRRNQLGYAYETDEVSRQAQADSMIALVNKINANLDTYEQLREVSGDQRSYSELERSLFDAFDEKWETYQELSFEGITMLQAGRREEAIDLLNGEARDVYTSFREDLRGLVSLTQRRAREALARADETFSRTYTVSITLLIITLLISAGIATWLVRHITVRVSDLSLAARRVARGDLNVRIQSTGTDELGHLAHGFNQMTTALRDYREQTERQADELMRQQRDLRRANSDLGEKSDRLSAQKAEIERKNKDLQEALERLRTTQEQLILNEKMASLGNLVAGVAHEINNPINFVTSNITPLRRDIAEILALLETYERTVAAGGLIEEFAEAEALKAELDFDLLNAEIEQLLTGIQEGASRTAAIVKGLRNFSRLDEDELKPIDVNDGIESTLLILHNEIKRRIEVVKDLGTLPEILGFPGKLNQVFLNILSNAVQAIEGKGTIWIKTWLATEKVHISIKDTGPGMSDEVKSRIFEPFFTTKAVGKGTGLGLSISFGIIEDHGGRIDVVTAPGKGSEFLITLPVRRA